MKPQAHIWSCSCCGREFNGTAFLPPPDWEWRGSRLICDDCGRDSDSRPPRRPTGPPPLRDSAAATDPALALLIRNGAAPDLADPHGARRAA